jgi:hypothetical protein
MRKKIARNGAKKKKKEFPELCLEPCGDECFDSEELCCCHPAIS